MTREKISAVYQIKNTVTGERYVGSSVNVYKRWVEHKSPSTWNRYPNSKLYQDFQEYGIENFIFAILAPVEPEHLKQVEQEFIDMLKPEYNSNRANGLDVERRKAYQQTERYKAICRAYKQTEKYKATLRAYRQTEKYKATRRAYRQTEKGKEANRKQARKDMKKYNHQLCYYNGETLFLATLSSRFLKAGIPHPVLEAKKYLLK